MNFKVIPSSNQQVWNQILNKAEIYDFYHTLSYHQLDNTGDPRLLVFEDRFHFHVLPLIFRKIPHTNWQDVTSVYGYAGWIRSAPEAPDLSVFDILEDYFYQEKIVSAFSRLHPLIDGSDYFLRGRIETLNTTTSINLHLDPSMQYKQYSKSVQRSIRQIKKKGVRIYMATEPTDISVFYSLYSGAMKRLNAAPQYYFPITYFLKLTGSTDFESCILFAEYDNRIIGGALFIITNKIMEYHLGAVADGFQYLSPLKLIIDQARIIGNERNLSVLHLGGGYGGMDDGLFTFKSRISTDRHSFKVWKWIVNEMAYNELSFGKLNSSFFPLYRC